MKTKTKERPILFNGPMVRAILAGKKTQTRRPLKPQPDGQPVRDAGDGKWYVDGGHWLGSAPAAMGDLLWVRETWYCDVDDKSPESERKAALYYRADGEFSAQFEAAEEETRWRPSIHMPRWAARIFLRVTDVRVQRVQDITEEDARAEGFSAPEASGFMVHVPARLASARAVFADLWAEVYGASSWERNEWVWALTFERVDQPRLPDPSTP